MLNQREAQFWIFKVCLAKLKNNQMQQLKYINMNLERKTKQVL
jgi:hypothetical protein